MEQTLRGSGSIKSGSDSVKSGTKVPTQPPPEPTQKTTRVQNSLSSLGTSLFSEHSTPVHSSHLPKNHLTNDWSGKEWNVIKAEQRWQSCKASIET